MEGRNPPATLQNGPGELARTAWAHGMIPAGEPLEGGIATAGVAVPAVCPPSGRGGMPNRRIRSSEGICKAPSSPPFWGIVPAPGSGGRHPGIHEASGRPDGSAGITIQLADIPAVARQAGHLVTRLGAGPSDRPAPRRQRRPGRARGRALELQWRDDARQPAATAAVEAAIRDIEQQPNQQRLVALVGGYILESVLVQVPIHRGPWLSPRGGEDDPVPWRQPCRVIHRRQGFDFWPTTLVQLEAVRRHEVDERVAACLVPRVLDGGLHEKRLPRPDLGHLAREPDGQVRWVAVRGEPPLE